MNSSGTKTSVFAITDGGVYTYYNNLLKLETRATGIDVTGTVTADGLVVDGNVGASIDLFNTTGGGQALNFRPEFATGSGDSDGLSINGYDGVSICTGSSTSRLERVRIDNAGHVIAGGGLTLGNGQVYSADKTLDDYEEGTWTPATNQAAGTYLIQTGYYTKIGNVLHVSGRVNVTGSSFSESPRITNLPFTVVNNNCRAPATCSSTAGITFNDYLTGEPYLNTTNMFLEKHTSGGNRGDVQAGEVAAAYGFTFSATYRVA
jgi:hypothetical protein